ncbi:MAG: ABC transporter substrate-binding protein [Pseudonocardiales bacterium]
MVVPAKTRDLWPRLALPVRVALIVVVILLVAVAVVLLYRELHTCGPGVESIDGQCIGVTGGGVHLMPDLANVLDKIRQENEEVDRSGLPAVSVAYLLALPKSENAALAVTSRHELEGAYLAQRVTNGRRTKAEEPLLRLLIANDGEDSEHWQQVVAALADEVSGPERLVAVVATGQSQAGRQKAIEKLVADHRIPVIASRLTGDNLTPSLTPSQVQGLARIAPSNSDQAGAVAVYLKREPGTARALLVQDTNPADEYSRSLGEAFQAAFRDDTHTVLTPVEKYNSQLSGYEKTMKGMLANICQQQPDVVFFAGHSPGLLAFVKALPDRPCPDLRINIVTADSAVNFVNTVTRGDDDLLRNGMNANISVRYTGLAHPESWTKSAESFKSGLKELFQSSCEEICFHSFFRGEPLDDGAAIMGYDAITTATTAINPGNDTPELIIQEFNRLHRLAAVAGASGWISLENGNPINKAVPILEVKPDGTVVFVQLSSPRGSPCRPDVPVLC